MSLESLLLRFSCYLLVTSFKRGFIEYQTLIDALFESIGPLCSLLWFSREIICYISRILTILLDFFQHFPTFMQLYPLWIFFDSAEIISQKNNLADIRSCSSFPFELIHSFNLELMFQMSFLGNSFPSMRYSVYKLEFDQNGQFLINIVLGFFQ